MTREEKKQKKLEEQEAARLAKIEKKNNRFYKKLRAKIDKLFESTKLTFCGKVFMLSLYACATSMIGIFIVSSVRAVLTMLLTLAKVDASKLELLAGASGVCWLVFILTLMLVIGFSAAEITYQEENDESLLEKEDEE